MTTAARVGSAPAEAREMEVVGRRRLPGSARVALYVVLILIALFFVMPIIVLFTASLKYKAELVTDTGLIPRNPSLQNYQALLAGQINFARAFTNSVVVAIAGTVLTVFLTSLSAYAFARIDFRGKGVLFSLLITTLLLPSVMFLVPQYKLIGQIGLYDTLPGFILPGLAGVFGVFFMRQFLLGIPAELEEAAYVDGANRFTTFFRIILPLMGPAIATLSVITFLAYWNDYLWPAVICNNNCTLPAALRLLQGSVRTTDDYGVILAGAVVAAVPVLIVYLMAQKYIVQSATSSGVKG